jgi:hypothetical protein
MKLIAGVFVGLAFWMTTLISQTVIENVIVGIM